MHLTLILVQAIVRIVEYAARVLVVEEAEATDVRKHNLNIDRTMEVLRHLHIHHRRKVVTLVEGVDLHEEAPHPRPAVVPGNRIVAVGAEVPVVVALN